MVFCVLIIREDMWLGFGGRIERGSSNLTQTNKVYDLRAFELSTANLTENVITIWLAASTSIICENIVDSEDEQVSHLSLCNCFIKLNSTRANPEKSYFPLTQVQCKLST